MTTTEQLEKILSQRIMIIDGAMGTMIQKHKLTEEDFRGERFAGHSMPQRGNNDLLNITAPHIIQEIHTSFINSGADIIETNTFNSNRISMADYGMEEVVSELNIAAAKIAKDSANKAMMENSERRIFVAGAIGPTNKTASLSPDVNNPGYRAVSFQDLVQNYTEQIEALIKGGVDILLVETVFDTLNCKAALFAINCIKEEKKIDIPVMVSGTITDASGRTLSGQTSEAFWISVSHANIISIGLNCALGAKQMASYIAELSNKAWVYISAYPNAGLPNEFGAYDETPEMMGSQLQEFLENKWVNILGGCCGTTPEHIAHIASIAKKYTPRQRPSIQYENN